MRIVNAAPTAQQYYRRFWFRLKKTIHLKDAGVDLTLSITAAIIGKFWWRTEDWLRVIASCVVAFVIFSVCHYVYKIIALWISRDQQLEMSERRNLEKELAEIKRRRLKELQNEAKFLWNNRAMSKDFLWQEHRKQWVTCVIDCLADIYNIDKAAAESKLCDCPAMKSYEETDYLECQMNKLSAILDSSFLAVRS
jgi:hypothetical protein